MIPANKSTAAAINGRNPVKNRRCAARNGGKLAANRIEREAHKGGLGVCAIAARNRRNAG
eukprot:3940516-Rhodomonas_salina.1